MHAHVEAGSGWDQGVVDSFRAGAPLCPPRYDEDSRERVKTPELVVDRKPREGEAEDPGSRTSGARAAVVASRRRVALRIGWKERDLQGRVKSAGGQWDPDRRVWMLRRDAAERLEGRG